MSAFCKLHLRCPTPIPEAEKIISLTYSIFLPGKFTSDPVMANSMQGGVFQRPWKDLFFSHMKEILKKRPSTEHHSWDVAILWDTRGGTRAWQRHQMGSDISETLNHCQRPQISRSLIMWDIARQVFCYLKLKAFITIPKNGSHTEDRNVSSHLNSIMIFL